MDKSNEDYSLSYAVSIVYMGFVLINIIPQIAKALNIELGVSSLIRVIIAIFLLLNLKIIIKRIDIKYIIIINIIIAIFLLNFMIINDKRYIKEYFVYFVGICVPLTTVIYCIKDYKILIDIMNRYSVIMGIIYGILIIVLGSKLANNKYSMGLSYALLIPALFMINAYWNSRKKIYICIFGILMVGILLYGSRGAIACMIVFVILNYIKKLYIEKKISTALSFGGLIIALGSTYKIILGYIIILLEKWSIESRTLNLLVQEGTYLSKREILYHRIWEEIISSPLSIRGISSDRFLLNTYPHNLFLELIYQFGVVLGGICVLGITAMFLYGLIYNKDKAMGELIMIFGCSSIVTLMLSRTFWTEYNFWVWVMLIISSINISKK